MVGQGASITRFDFAPLVFQIGELAAEFIGAPAKECRGPGGLFGAEPLVLDQKGVGQLTGYGLSLGGIEIGEGKRESDCRTATTGLAFVGAHQIDLDRFADQVQHIVDRHIRAFIGK